MAFVPLTAAYVSLGGTTYHDHINKVELNVKIDDLETTNFASLGWKERIGGLKDGTVNLTFLQDFAAANLDATMWPLLGTLVPYEFRPTQAAVGTGNPKFTGNLFIAEWKPIAGKVGDLAVVEVTFPTSGAVARATA